MRLDGDGKTKKSISLLFRTSEWRFLLRFLTSWLTSIRATHVGDDQLDIVSTPGLGMSPITPKSLGSGFPSTPTDLSAEMSGLSLEPKLNCGDPYNNDNVFKGKPVDPTTLFVGGLEMFGPSAWDEGKVRKCFEKYGTLENVKFVRPCKSKTIRPLFACLLYPYRQLMLGVCVR